MLKNPAIYIVTNRRNGTLYVGVTTNLIKRIYEHKHSIIKGFSSKYACDILVYFEFFQEIHAAISREKQIKGWSRSKKLLLIENFNEEWCDLYEFLLK